jgi:membrane protein YdbS with pleckstrin-like domain
MSEENERENGPVFEMLDPLAVKRWRIEGVLSIGTILAVALVGGSSLWALTPVPGWAVVPALVLLAVLLYFSAGWFPPRRYAAWSYRLSEQVLELRYGVFWKTSVMIPLTRLQHVDLQRGPLDRRFGLASLVVHTAGTSKASHEIPFLAEKTGLELRERLIEAADLNPE